MVLGGSYVAALPLGLLMTVAGALHFTNTKPYVKMMKGLPFEALHEHLVYASGVVETAGGVALLSPTVEHRRLAARFVFLTILAVSPANVNMYLNDVPFGNRRFSYGWTGDHAKRFVAQLVLLAYALALF